MSTLRRRSEAVGRLFRALDFGVDDVQLVVGWTVYALLIGAFVLYAAFIAGAAIRIVERMV